MRRSAATPEATACFLALVLGANGPIYPLYVIAVVGWGRGGRHGSSGGVGG